MVGVLPDVLAAAEVVAGADLGVHHVLPVHGLGIIFGFEIGVRSVKPISTGGGGGGFN